MALELTLFCRTGPLGIHPPFTFHWLNNRFTNWQLILLPLTVRTWVLQGRSFRTSLRGRRCMIGIMCMAMVALIELLAGSNLRSRLVGRTTQHVGWLFNKCLCCKEDIYQSKPLIVMIGSHLIIVRGAGTCSVNLIHFDINLVNMSG